MLVLVYEGIPFVIPTHSDRATTELLNGLVRLICFPAKDTCISIVGFLYLTNNDGFKLSTRALKIQECLKMQSVP